MSWLIYYFLFAKYFPIQNLFRKGNDWIERKKPTVGISALRYGEFMPIAYITIVATIYVSSKTEIVRNMLVSHALSASTR